jgi:hypothetical protein
LLNNGLLIPFKDSKSSEFEKSKKSDVIGMLKPIAEELMSDPKKIATIVSL